MTGKTIVYPGDVTKTLASQVDGRDWSISALRLASMLAIIACHVCQALNNDAAWWLNAGVQVFLVISGFLYGKREAIERPVSWFARRLQKIWIPYVVVAAAILSADIVSGVAEVSVFDAVLGLTCLRPSRIPNAAHLWYVSVALFCYLVTPLLFLFRERFGTISLAIPSVILAILGGGIIPNGFWVLEYAIGFALGSLVKKKPDSEQTIMERGSLLSGALIALLFVSYKIELIDFDVNGTGYILAHFTLGVLSFCFIRWILRCTQFNPKMRIKKLLGCGDAYSYEIYLVHNVFIQGNFSVLAGSLFPMPMAITECLMLSLAGGVLIHKAIARVDRFL